MIFSNNNKIRHFERRSKAIKIQSESLNRKNNCKKDLWGKEGQISSQSNPKFEENRSNQYVSGFSLYCKNSEVTDTQTVCNPWSIGPVLQQPSLKKPVKGSWLQGWRSSPRTLREETIASVMPSPLYQICSKQIWGRANSYLDLPFVRLCLCVRGVGGPPPGDRKAGA